MMEVGEVELTTQITSTIELSDERLSELIGTKRKLWEGINVLSCREGDTFNVEKRRISKGWLR